MTSHLHSLLKEEMLLVIPARIMTEKVEERVMALEKRVEALELAVKELREKS